MITTEEIAIRVYQTLRASKVKAMISGAIAYQRKDYAKEDVIIVPKSINGEGSLRFGQINVNIHVPDVPETLADGSTVYNANFPRLMEIRKAAIDALQNHYELGYGYNWNVGLINPPMAEQGHNEHFVSFALELTVRERSITK